MTMTAAELVRMVARLSSRDRRLAVAMRGGDTLSEPSAMERALVEAVGVLESDGAPYALIGSLAVAMHTAHPRATQDVAIAVRSNVDREHLLAGFMRAGFVLRGRFEHSLNLVHAGGDPVQVAFDPGFDAAIARAEEFQLGGSTIRIVRREDLITLKERAAADPGRRRSKALQDRADVEMLRGDVPGPDEGW